MTTGNFVPAADASIAREYQYVGQASDATGLHL